ncbi:MAG: ion transporter, partial [Persicimonas sp.]
MDLQHKARNFLNHDTTEIVVALLIVLSVLLIFVEVALGEQHRYYGLLVAINDGITGIFIVELAIRFYAEKRKLRFFRKCWYDILAVIPFLRAFRFLRVLRLLRLYRVGFILARRLRRVSATFHVVRVEYIIIGLTVITVVLMGGLSMLAVEGHVNGDFERLESALWYAAMTLIGAEPIGGDPQTAAGRAITVAMMLSGMTFFAVLIGTVSAIMIDTLQKVRLHTMEFDELRDHVVICGWNQAGSLIVRELISDGGFKHVVIVAQNEAVEGHPLVQSHPGQVLTLEGDYTSMECLREAGVQRASVALLLADSSIEERPPQDRDARTVLTAMLVEKLNPEIYT